MKILIVDDELPARRRLRTLLDSLGGHEVVGEAASGDAALALAAELAPDVVLLDIRMPGADGLTVAARLGLMPQPPAVIFTTAYGEHALEAFEAEAVGYLLKPVRRERLGEALQKARRLNRAQLQAAAELAGQPPAAPAHVLCRRRGGSELIPLSAIRYFQADHKYVTVSHLHGSDLIEESLKTLEQRFPDQLLRIHRNALVNLAYIAGTERCEGRQLLLLRGSEERLEVSRRHLAELRAVLRRLGV